MLLSRRSALAALSLVAVAPRALAAPTPQAPLSTEDSALVARAVAYLQALSSARGRFIQTDARRATVEGEFYLQRPGKARFAYDPPSGVTMASDGSLVAVLNARLKTYEAYPLGMTPLSLFLAKEIRLDRGVAVRRVIRQQGGFSIVATDAKKKTEGALTLTFTDPPLALQGWTITDAQGQATQVRLVGFERAGPFPQSLFELKDPRPKPILRH